MCLRVFTGAPMENLAILDTPHGAGAAELSTVDTENTLLYRQWELLPHLSSTAKARSGEWDPMQPKGPVQGALQQRLPLPPGQQPTLPLRESPFPPGALPCANLPINGMFEQTLHLCVSVHHFIRESGLRVLTAQLPQSQRAFCRRADAVGSGFTDSVTKAPPPVRAPALGQSE